MKTMRTTSILFFCNFALCAILFGCAASDAVDVAKECAKVECPSGTTPNLEMAASGGCDGSVDVNVAATSGGLAGSCVGTGECRLYCEFPTKCCGDLVFNEDGYSCGEPCSISECKEIALACVEHGNCFKVTQSGEEIEGATDVDKITSVDCQVECMACDDGTCDNPCIEGTLTCNGNRVQVCALNEATDCLEFSFDAQGAMDCETSGKVCKDGTCQCAETQASCNGGCCPQGQECRNNQCMDPCTVDCRTGTDGKCEQDTFYRCELDAETGCPQWNEIDDCDSHPNMVCRVESNGCVCVDEDCGGVCCDEGQTCTDYNTCGTRCVDDPDCGTEVCEQGWCEPKSEGACPTGTPYNEQGYRICGRITSSSEAVSTENGDYTLRLTVHPQGVEPLTNDSGYTIR